VVLFGAFLVWAVAGFSIRRRQDRLAGIQPQPPKSSGTVGALASGIVVWAVFAFWLHRILIGVSPMAM
jgi:uncharacterized membrane protein